MHDDIWNPYDFKARAEARAKSEALIREIQELLNQLDADPTMRASFAENGYGPLVIEEMRRRMQHLTEALKQEREAARRFLEADANVKLDEEALSRTTALCAAIVRHNLKDDPDALRMLGLDKPLGEADDSD